MLHTIKKNSGIIFNDNKKRWKTPDELLVAQCFPIPIALPKPRQPPTCSFGVERSDRKRGQLSAQAGNSIHVNVIGLVCMHCIKDIGNNECTDKMLPMLARIVAEH